MNTGLSFKNPYICMISLGFILIAGGFRFPAYLENYYLREVESLAKEQSQNIARRNDILDSNSKWTEEKGRELARLDDDLPGLRKKALEVSALRGELNLRIILSQIAILIGAVFSTLGSVLWISDWKREKDRQKILTSDL